MIARHLAAGLVMTGLFACNARAQDKAGPNDNKAPEGFTLLFNGKDLTNWKGVIPINRRAKLSTEELEKAQKASNEKALPHWKVEDGILYYDGKGDSLQTAKDYGDFEFWIDWKIEEKGDSGIYLRGQPQVQVWDSDNSTGARGEDKGSGSGGLWNNPPKSKGKMPLKKADKKPGEWNTFRIVMKGDDVTVYLNGELVVDKAPLANYWEKGKPLPATGPIELQHHGDKLWFKNIYIKELK
jgi:3-keto-disaccharide hydrolase